MKIYKKEKGFIAEIIIDLSKMKLIKNRFGNFKNFNIPNDKYFTEKVNNLLYLTRENI